MRSKKRSRVGTFSVPTRNLNQPFHVTHSQRAQNKFKFPQMKKNFPLFMIWFMVLWIVAPLIWDSLFNSPYVLWGATGLQEATKSAPILIRVLIWAIVLSIPKYRNSKAIYGAGGFLLAIGLFLIYYTGFERMGGFVFISAGVGLMRHPETSRAI